MPASPLLGVNVQLDNGSAAAPTSSYRNDPLTGQFLKSAGTIGWSSSGSEVLSVGSVGLVNSKPISTARTNVASAAAINSLSSSTSFVKLTGSTATTVNGIAAGRDGQILRVWNATGQDLTISNNSSSGASGEKITTCTGSDVATTANGFAEFIYDTDASPAVWICSYVTA